MRVPHEGEWSQQESPEAQRFRARWIRVTSWKWNTAMSLPSRGDSQGMYELVIARLQQPWERGCSGTDTIPTWWGEVKPCKNWIQHCEKERGMTGGVSDLPGWEQQTQEEAETSYPIAKSILEQNSFKQARWDSFEQSAAFPPSFYFGNILATFFVKEDEDENEIQDDDWGRGMERGGWATMKIGKTCWSQKFPGHLLCPVSLETACLHCRWHHLPGSLEHSWKNAITIS